MAIGTRKKKRASAARRRDRLMLALHDRLRQLNDPVAIQTAAVQVLGEHLGCDWANYSEYDEDYAHASYDSDQVANYFEAVTQAALVLAAFRAPFRGRSTPVNAWWGTFDLAVSLFSGRRADPPSDDFIMRNGGDAEQVSIGWWPGDPDHERAAFFAYAYPASDGFADASLSPAAARWDEQLGEYVLDWEDIREEPDPRALALEFARSAFRHACNVCEWDPALAATAEGVPPPIR